jgi:hypothetical protein
VQRVFSRQRQLPHRAAAIFAAGVFSWGLTAVPLKAQIETRVFSAVGDTFNYDKVGGTTVNNGGSSSLEVGALNGDRNSRTLIRFDPSSVLSSNINVVSAILRLTTTRIDNFTSLGIQDSANSVFTLSAYRVTTTNWVEGTAIFANQTGSVSWDWRRYNIAGETWDVAGPGPASADVADVATATMVWTQTPSLGWRFTGNTNFTWDVAADLNAWNSDRTTAIPTWVIISDKENTGTKNNGVVFASRQNANIALHPQLTVEFIALPEPSATLLFSLGGLLWLRRRQG